MVKKVQYQTKQMAELTAYLRSVQGRHVTVADIQKHLQEQGSNVGTTTIYRRLERMIDEGTVAKYIVDEKSSACFEYLGDEGIKNCATEHFHCKCEKCGKLIHMECDELEHIYKHMLSEHGFKVNAFKTVIYGVCEDCARA